MAVALENCASAKSRTISSVVAAFTGTVNDSVDASRVKSGKRSSTVALIGVPFCTLSVVPPDRIAAPVRARSASQVVDPVSPNVCAGTSARALEAVMFTRRKLTEISSVKSMGTGSTLPGVHPVISTRMSFDIESPARS